MWSIVARGATLHVDIKEHRYAVTPIRVRAHCRVDGGEYVCTGNGFGNNLGTQWEHKCSICEHRLMLPKKYPFVEYEE